MKLPKMIIFDFGNTLIYEPEFDGVRGIQAVLEYAISNKHNLSAEEVNDVNNKLFEKIGRDARDNGLEIHNHTFQKLLYEYLEITIRLSDCEIEKIFWDNAAPATIMPDVDKMIDYINARGIRSGVISNISFSGASLKERINQLLPNNKFEYVIASSEYIFRKPNPIMFEIALKKAGLKSSEVWYCGDNVYADINGALSADIFPVWYQSDLKDFLHDSEINVKPKGEHLCIYDWAEFIGILEKL